MTRPCYSVHFNEITNRPGTTFQASALSQKHVRYVCDTGH